MSSINQSNTSVRCLHCNTGSVVVSVTETCLESNPGLIGPGNRITRSYSVGRIYCDNNNCALVFRIVPGQPQLAQQVVDEHIAKLQDDKKSPESTLDIQAIIDGRESDELVFCFPDDDQNDPGNLRAHIAQRE